METQTWTIIKGGHLWTARSGFEATVINTGNQFYWTIAHGSRTVETGFAFNQASAFGAAIRAIDGQNTGGQNTGAALASARSRPSPRSTGRRGLRSREKAAVGAIRL
jgi:hypothetical protein